MDELYLYSLVNKELAEINKKVQFNNVDEAYDAIEDKVATIADEFVNLISAVRRLYAGISDDEDMASINEKNGQVYMSALHVAAKAIRTAAMARKATITNLQLEEKEV